MARLRGDDHRMSATADRLAAYRECERQILLGGQSARSPDGKSVTMADLGQIQEQISKLQSQLAREQRGVGIGVAYSDFTDFHGRSRCCGPGGVDRW